MTRRTEPQVKADSLPSFFGADAGSGPEPRNDDANATTATDEYELADADADADAENADPAAAESDGDAAPHAGASDDASPPDDAEDGGARSEAAGGEAGLCAARSRRTPAGAAPVADAAASAPAAGGGLGTALGIASLLAGAAVGVMQGRAMLPAEVGAFGVTPAMFVVIGVVLLAAAGVRRRLGALWRHVDARESGQTEGTESLRQSLQFLVDAQHASNERPPAAGEELQHVLVALQRQDEKINNLTRAIKMYGKPLMEIAAQGTELASTIGQVKTGVDGTAEANRQAFTRLEQTVKAGGSIKQEIEGLVLAMQEIGAAIEAIPKHYAKDTAELHGSLQKVAAAIDVLPKQNAKEIAKEIAELHVAVQKATATIESIPKQSGKMPSLDPLQQAAGRIEVAVQAISQRLEDSEVRRSLLRLEETAQKSREEVQQLLRGESVQKATTQLQQRLDNAAAQLQEGIARMRDGNIGGLETAVRDIQREVAGVATSVAQIQAAVKSGAMRAAAPAAAAAPASGPAAAASPAAPKPASADAVPASAATPAPAAAAAPEGSGGGYSTGKHSTKGKNVLGAIAKLKQMKT